jgi:predicted ATP-dependent endonuclease of OLD family
VRITELTIKNYRSFDTAGQTIKFPTVHCALVGKNNSGKSNIFSALNLVLGAKNPAYIKFEEDDYFDINLPIEIKVVISDITGEDKNILFTLPNLTKQQKGALNSKISNGEADITFLLRKNYEHIPLDEDEEQAEESQDIFEIKLWGFNVYRKKEDIRKFLIRMLLVPAVRDYKNELSASKWTQYGQLMKSVLEDSPKYAEIKSDLQSLNEKIQEIFKSEKEKLLRSARIVSYVDDISFQLTKENHPSELLRNLEIFIKEGGKLFNIDYVGTGTQSAIIIGILELALKNKSTKNRLFCIEEPEAFIHPHGIRYLGSLIKNISSEQNTQVIISTHSLSLTANFEPKEIIKVDKENGKTVIRQDPSFDVVHFRRFIHQDNAELFFSDRVILVEGPTEKHLFNNIDKITKQNPTNPDSEDCNFDKINVGIIRMDSVDSIVNYIKILSAFGIEYCAIVDNDFVLDPSKQNKLKELCREIGVNYQNNDMSQLVNDLKSKNILVNIKGEIEDLFPDQDIANIIGSNTSYIQEIKNKYPNKTSKAFKELFGTGKAEYAIRIADYYLHNNFIHHPLEDIIRNLYNNEISNVNF